MGKTRMFWEEDPEKRNFEGMYYQGKKEGIDFLLCPRDKKSKCLNFRASEKYKHAMDMYNDGGEKLFCQYCNVGKGSVAPKRRDRAKDRLDSVHARNRRLSKPDEGVLVGNRKIPYRPRRVA